MTVTFELWKTPGVAEVKISTDKIFAVLAFGLCESGE